MAGEMKRIHLYQQNVHEKALLFDIQFKINRKIHFIIILLI